MTIATKTEQLIEAHLDFLQHEFSLPETIALEFSSFYQWFRKQHLQDLWSFEEINHLLQKQILATPASSFLIEQIAEHIRFALIHPCNDSTRIEDVIPVLTVDRIAQYVASKSKHRERLIKSVVNSPAFSAMITQLIQHAIQDYLDNSIVSKKVPGVSRFMKMGKSVLETVTDSSLDDTIHHYLQKNILKLSQMSEHVLNQHFDNDKLYHFQANLWHKIKKQPLSVLRQYIEVEDLPNTVKLGHEIWDFMRQSEYLKQQIHDGVHAWYVRNQERNFDLLLRDLNIDESLIQHELQQLLQPVIQTMCSSEYLRKRARVYLERFYASESAQNILNG
ncbi:hypothetical protein ACE5JW_01340 [Acinetobacter radioresistens]|jgi:hypothetical protein|uniref:Uncharacterized protein n=1 Tax=Acinetobacter radioresistens SK82 TaxID=596318 RepID=A0ABP2GMJ9_ACIRA|nr:MULTISPECIES: hypothetical protein [Acinetobacter]EET82975.1 hypothetical protein ACIRA0001_2134 [Acinetobacter radioresistens SK82]EEY86632.1 hypothetical protein HMPREF0018_01205 [Acinetobacter radioresistens SH164]ENV85213.1 hypothetical protein F940_02348 [Acinetobacter radioresistens NIPH 2130]EXC33172.1 hypothetical protein J520_1186 [Acinetobacter sp. 869535]EXE59246.1 hypothetical protein J579_1132 [Acinetobacter sp. 1239920]